MSDPHMDGAYGKSRSELIHWLNLTLPTPAVSAIGGPITQVEQCGSGVPYLFLLPHIFPGNHTAAAAPQKAKLPARQEYDSLVNLKLLQDVFTKNQMNRVIDIPKMSKRNFQANLEFLQWFRWLYESRTGGGPPPAAAATNGAAEGGTPQGRGGTAATGVSRGRPVTASPGGSSSSLLRRAPGSTVSSARTTTTATRPQGNISSRSSDISSRARSLSASSRGGPAPGGAPVAARGISPLRSKSPSLHPTSTAPTTSPFLKNAIRGLRAVTPTRGGTTAGTVGRSPMHSSRSTGASSSLPETSTYVELERRFYYDKLRAIEELVRAHQGPNRLHTNASAGEKYDELLNGLQKVLYAAH